jgi:hypothetical protein
MMDVDRDDLIDPKEAAFLGAATKPDAGQSDTPPSSPNVGTAGAKVEATEGLAQ